MSQHHFFLSHLSDPLLDRVPGNESIDHDFVLLSDTMRSGQSLNVIVRIPIGVIDDDRVGSVQVDAQATGSGGQEEDELLGAFSIETINGVLTQCARDRAINSLVLVTLTFQKVFEQIE